VGFFIVETFSRYSELADYSGRKLVIYIISYNPLIIISLWSKFVCSITCFEGVLGLTCNLFGSLQSPFCFSNKASNKNLSRIPAGSSVSLVSVPDWLQRGLIFPYFTHVDKAFFSIRSHYICNWTFLFLNFALPLYCFLTRYSDK